MISSAGRPLPIYTIFPPHRSQRSLQLLRPRPSEAVEVVGVDFSLEKSMSRATDVITAPKFQHKMVNILTLISQLRKRSHLSAAWCCQTAALSSNSGSATNAVNNSSHHYPSGTWLIYDLFATTSVHVLRRLYSNTQVSLSRPTPSPNQQDWLP